MQPYHSTMTGDCDKDYRLREKWIIHLIDREKFIRSPSSSSSSHTRLLRKAGKKARPIRLDPLRFTLSFFPSSAREYTVTTMLSVNSMLNQHEPPSMQTHSRRPSALDIASLLCPLDTPTKSPLLSPSITFSPSSISSYYSPSEYHHHTPEEEWDQNHQKSLHNWPAAVSQDTQASLLPLPSLSLPRTGCLSETTFSRELCHRPRSRSISSSYSFSEPEDPSNPDTGDECLKPKRRRANAKQLEVLNRVFERTSFPTTQVRNELGQQLGMSPRTVQIWFQNRRQAIRMQEKKQPKDSKPTDNQ
ncbi:hypothetical protein CLU79DRAFT_768000 [Phycomyces nitens]|nr:hypothetical protein CLU79DRAFT_768000 [Phycomyces nitens]